MVLIVILLGSLFSGNVLSSEETFSIFAVDCGEKAYLLDYKEMYSLESNVEFDLNGTDVDHYMKSYFKRMQNFDFGRTQVYRDLYAKLSSRTKFVENINFGPINDNLGFVSWDGCQIKTVARATDPAIYQSGFVLFIDNSIFQKMDNRSRAGLYFNYLLNLDHIFVRFSEHTEYTRYFNALIASNSFRNIHEKDYPYLYESVLDFNTVSFYGLFFKVYSFPTADGRRYSIRFNDSGEIEYAKISSDRFYFVDKPLYKTLSFFNAQDLKVSFIDYGELKRESSLYANLNGVKFVNGMSSCFGEFDFEGKFANLQLTIEEDRVFVTSITGQFKYNNISFKKFKINGDKISIDKQSISERDFGSFSEIKSCNFF